MLGLTPRRLRSGSLMVTLLVGVALAVPAAPPAIAGQNDGPPADVNCAGDSTCSAEVRVDRSWSSEHGGGSTSTYVEPDCWFSPWEQVEPALTIRRVLAIFEAFLPILQLPLAPVSEYKAAKDAHKDDPEWMWYLLKCKPGISALTSEQALSISQTTEWFGRQVARLDLLGGPGTETPTGVSLGTLLEIAQDAFTIPEPEVTQSPVVQNTAGATLVNLDTWFWAEDAQETYEITVSAGPVSVTLTAKNDGYVLSSPFGSTQCTHEQFTTAWAEGAEASAGCTLVFDRASPAGAGHEVQVTSRWDVEWTATGLPGTHNLAPLTPSSTFNVPVTEAGAVVTGVG